MKQMKNTKGFRSVCHECYMGHGVLVHVKDGKMERGIQIHPSPKATSYALSAKTSAWTG